MKTTGWFAATVLVLMTGQAAPAAPITYNLGGTVTQLGLTPPGVNIGDQIPIAITVNDPGTGGPSYAYTQGNSGTALVSSALFGGIDYTSLFQSINIKVGSSISFLTTVPKTNYGFSLSLTGAKNGVLATGALPTSLNPADFTAGTFRVESIYENDTSYAGSINGIGGVAIVPVPEPGSWLLLGAGAVGAVWQTARRRRASPAN